MTTKGGTNEIHGSLFETNRNNVTVWRAPATTSPTRRPNSTATSSAAPWAARVFIPKVYNGKNRTFWFFNYEGYKQRSGTFRATTRCRTEAMRNGDFSGLVDSAGNLSRPSTTR